MDIGEIEIHDVVRSIWESVLGWDFQPAAVPDVTTNNESFHRGCVEISGAWTGTVVFTGSDEMARQAAAVMFDMTPEALTPEHISDAFGELTNMIGGNLKGLLPGPSVLGLPTLARETDSPGNPSDARPGVVAAFVGHDQPCLVKLLPTGP
jgi:chemotaxis protein CheX